jgi:murein L,D-transpeptidase YcbB/YkuD
METKNKILLIVFLFCIGIGSWNCNSQSGNTDKEIVANPDQMNQVVSDKIKASIQQANSKDGKINDSLQLKCTEVLQNFYAKNNYQPIWSDKENWTPLSDSLFNLMQNLPKEGLFPEDYQASKIAALKPMLLKDSTQKIDASYWCRADLLLTDGLLHIIKDLKVGRLAPDSMTLNKDSVLSKEYYTTTLQKLLSTNKLRVSLQSLEPQHKGYWELKRAFPLFWIVWITAPILMCRIRIKGEQN